MSEIDNIILHNYEYNINKNELHEGEIIYDDTVDEVEAPSSTLILNRYIEMKVCDKNDKVIRQTEEYFSCPITKIKTFLFKCILNTLPDSTGYISRVGVFDDHNDKTANHDTGGNGYFFALIDNVLNIGIRKGTIDNGIDTLIPQSLFNVNSFKEGRWDIAYTFIIETAHKGDINFSINTGNSTMLLHYFSYSDITIPLISNCILPARYEITKLETINNVGSLKKYSTQVYCSNKFYNNEKEYSSLKSIVQSRGKFFSLNSLITRGYIQARTHTHEGGKKTKIPGNNYGKQHSSHHYNNHITPNGYHTPHTRNEHINAYCNHINSTRCRHKDHTGYNSSISEVFKSSICTKVGCDYHHHKQVYAKPREYYPIFSLRLIAYKNRLSLKQFCLIAHTKDNEEGFILSIIKNPIFVGVIPHHWHGTADGSIEYDIDSNHICQTKIDIIYQRWVYPNNGYVKILFDKLSNHLEDFINFNSNIQGEPNIYTIVAQRIGINNPNILMSMEWLE